MSELLSNVDLNLLKAFVVVYQERNLKRAAERLYVTAPAISIKLNKLRHEVGGTLFIKVPTGFEPTALADNLYKKVEPLLNQLHSEIVSLKGFEPAELTGRVNIDLSQHFIGWFAPKLFQQVQNLAPKTTMTFNGFSDGTLEKLQTGDVDIGIEYARVNTPQDILEVPLERIPLAMAVRKDHPITKPTAHIEEMVEHGIAMIELNIQEAGKRWYFVNEVKKNLGITLNPQFASSSIEAVVGALCASNMVCPVSKHLIKLYPDKLKSIDFVELLDIASYPVSLYVHRRNRHSPKHQWLIEQIKKSFPNPIN
ncbi:LysR family transcriptional regulator [Vibrio sp. ZSDE26]|uniref:LysR family transcriptional regulator n=1 Tax=Vibrio amylolyticus TaxID=2847292 RepID=A0A9X1XHM2_9VIBR|nr:LysR family transcriptional regulator [Vibrio amylolyticus]MCK6261913.1 LysR family transcriptional regulator [Vibrio amylolyticus]